MIKVVPFLPEHMVRLELQAAQRHPMIASPEEHAAAGDGIVGLMGDEVMFCAGRVQGARTHVWATLSAKAGPHMVDITRAARFYLNVLCDVEAWIYPEFEAAHRWAKILSFKFDRRIETHVGPMDVYIRPRRSWAGN